MFDDKIPPSGRSYTCSKKDCFHCYEMNRIKQQHPEYHWVKKQTYRYRKEREFKELLEKYKAA